MNSCIYGTNHCQRVKALIIKRPIQKVIENKHVIKRQYREELFEQICLKRFQKKKPTKKDLLELVSLIKSKDLYCPNPPGQDKSKDLIYNWIIDNLNSYFIILDKV